MSSNRRKAVRGGAEVQDSASFEGGADGYQNMPQLHGRTCGPTRRSTKGQWTAEEDELLYRAVQRFQGRSWKKIAECFKDRTDVQCLHRWQKVLNPELVKGPWSKEEDDIIVEMVNKYGAKKWSTIAQALPGRIGKQCRERWHNHLNPAINKDAWTQEEELTLIRAHQIYGNKWAELTKFLPGRSDNSIKNHWNSSVKKKLDSYVASGLLAQFRAFPNVGSSDICNSSSSRMQESSRDNSSLQDGAEAEDVSECSQSSTAAGRSQSDCNLPPVYPQEELNRCEERIYRKGQSPHSSSRSNQYYTHLDEIAYGVPEVPRGTANCANSCEKSISRDAVSTENNESSLVGSHNLLHSSAPGLVHETSGLVENSQHCRVGWDENMESRPVMLQKSMSFNTSTSMGNTYPVENAQHCRGGWDENMQSRSVPLQKSLSLNASTSTGNTIVQPQNQNNLCYSRGDCTSVTFIGEGTNVCFPLGHMAQHSDINLDRCTDLVCQSKNQSCETTETLASNSHYLPGCSDVLGASGRQTLYTDAPVHPNHAKTISGGEYEEERDVCTQTQNSELFPDSCDGFAYECNSRMSPCGGNMENLSLPVEPDRGIDATSSDLVENFCSVSLDAGENVCGLDESTPVKTQQHDSEALFYEPPRFPSLDLPFLSCDLIPSGSDLQQAYSPLGIRQLMMSSVNCSSQFSLWDSPSRDDSPDLLLKSAAKSFLCTPSILKKRQRELLSPVQDQKSDKKLERDTRMRSDISSLDALFDENGTCTTSISCIEGVLLSPKFQQKKNIGDFDQDKENHDHSCTALSDGITSENAVDNFNSRDKQKQEIGANNESKVDAGGATPMVQDSSRVLVEQDVNAPLFFSPDRDEYVSNQSLNGDIKTPKDFSYREITLSRAVRSSCSDSWTVNISPINGERKHNVDSAQVASLQCQALQRTHENAGNAELEGYTLYGNTPLMKRGIESPSAWKSPWFANAFIPGPRIDTDITIEDIGYLMSPGEGCYDALALMRQLGEQSAAALAEAQEVLASENPESSLGQCSERVNVGKEDSLGIDKPLSSDALNERRVLDFSECETPGKSSENKKNSGIASAVSFSSPSSYLMKGCR